MTINVTCCTNNFKNDTIQQTSSALCKIHCIQYHAYSRFEFVVNFTAYKPTKNASNTTYYSSKTTVTASVQHNIMIYDKIDMCNMWY